jgi:hypothetical protein
MRKAFAFMISALLTVSTVNAQQAFSRWRTSLVMGPSFPVGNFGNTNWDSIPGRSGATPGIAAELGFQYALKNPHIRIGLVLGWQENGGNTSPVKDGLLIYNPDPNQIRVQMDHWSVWKILAGPEFNWPISLHSKFRIESGVEAGILKTSIPAYSYQVYFADTHDWSAVGNIGSVSLPASFCYQFHAGMEYRLNHSILLKADANYSHAESSVQQYQYGFPPNANFAVMKKYSYPISSVNILIGFAFEF